jgi:peptide/nickel transport system substrate-binding protein
MNWSDAQVVAALQRLAGDSRHAAQDRALVAATLQRALPVIPIAWSRQTSAISTRLRGASIDPYERSYRLSQLEWTR